MLSRVADALFWMSRYLERSEQAARLVDATIHLDLDLRGVVSWANELHWMSLESILQQPAAPAVDDTLPSHAAITRWLTFGTGNPASIMSSISRSRNNARSIRGAINSEMWRELNKLYWRLSDPDFREAALESPHELLQTVQIGSQLFHGVCDATLMHDEGWQFIRIGRHLERAVHVLRILDAKFQVLRSLNEQPDLSLANLHWASVLKSCNGYEAYQRLYISRVEPDRVVEFLVFNHDFPQSVRFSLDAAASALADISSAEGGKRGEASRILGRLIGELEYGDVSEILAKDAHAFFANAQMRCGDISLALQRQFALNH